MCVPVVSVCQLCVCASGECASCVCVGFLQEYDLNKDGLISYREFEMVRKVLFDTVCLL